MRVKILTLALLVGILAVSGCSGLGNSDTDTPEKGAKAWLEALAASDGLKLDDRTCNAKQDELKSQTLLTSAFQLIGQELIGVKAKVDVSKVNVEAIKTSGNSAQVRITGKLRVGVALAVDSQELDTVWNMVRENDVWKYCGENQQVNAKLKVDASATLEALRPSDEVIERFRIQPDDFSQPLEEKEFRKLDSSASPQNGELVGLFGQYQEPKTDNPNYGIILAVFIFDSPTNATKGIDATAKALSLAMGTTDPQIEPFAFGDEAVKLIIPIQDLNGANLPIQGIIWRRNNAVVGLAGRRQGDTNFSNALESLAKKMDERIRR